jgi:hypothetical protein
VLARWFWKSTGSNECARSIEPQRAIADYLDRETARIDPPDFRAITDGTELVVPISVVDRAGVEVVHAGVEMFDAPDVLVDKQTGALTLVYGLLGKMPADNLVPIGDVPE